MALLVAELQIVSMPPVDGGEELLRTFLQHIRTLGAIPQADDPMGILSIDTEA